MNKFNVGDVVWFLGGKWRVKAIVCSRIYIRNKSDNLKIPRVDDVKPIIRAYATLGES